APTFVAEQWLRFFRIPDCWPRFHRNLIAACALHDWGKANDSFQKALIGAGEQAIRHEHLSALLIAMPKVHSWLKSAQIDVPLVLSAVLTHHFKAADTVSGFAQKLASSRFRLVNDDDGFQQTLDIAASELGIAPLSFGDLPVSWTFDSGKQSVRDVRTIVQDDILEPYEQLIRRNESERRLLLAVRSALIAVDAAGSGIVRAADSSVATWIQQSVTQRPVLTHDQIHEAIIEKRRQQMVSCGQWHDWNDFQLVCDHLPERALLLAPCGSGKTLAAWRWIAAQLAKRPAGHAIFLYPTRATAREGFQDYVSWAPETDAALMHGTSEFDLDGMFENAPDDDERRGRNYEAERRLFALAYWPRRVFSATVDQFLAFMQYSYGAMCMLPVLTNSVLVIDEVHSFDNNMFSALKDFLKAFDIPVLCMTATLPETRRRDLVETCGLAAPQAWPEDLQEVADRRRYRFMHVSNRKTAESSVRTALAEGKRVLWVVNQVKRAHDIVRSFVPELPDDNNREAELHTGNGVPVVCYHSRFCLRDRVARHAETMKYLKATHTGAALGVTTQVCEMSLDIDVDLLVTEECPVASMVQRMGRCNRNRNARSLTTSGHVVVYPPENNENLPYDRNDLAGLPEFLKRAESRDLSQSDLDHIMSAVPCPAAPGDKLSRFLESGAYAVGPRDDGGEGFRDTNEFSRQCVLQQDIAKYLSASRKEQPGFIVPVPNRRILCGDEFSAAATGLPSWLFVAPNENYHRAVGFLDRPASEWSSST
ncbi:MAG: CRISPR-associated helicase Cas3', partial [Planctomycetaceae bacterium]